jgi:hypothetical protein
MHGNASASGQQVAIVESSFDPMTFHARRDRIPTGPAEILSMGWCNMRTLSTCGGFPLLVRLRRARGSLGDISDIELPNQRTALFRLARVHLCQQIRLSLGGRTYGSYLTSPRHVLRFGVQILFCACRSFRRAVVLVTSHRLNCKAISSSSIPNRSPVFQKLDEHIQAYLYVNYRRTVVTFGNDASQPTGNCTNGSVGSELSALS